MVTQLVEKYQAVIDKRPMGKPFNEVYDMNTLKPTAAWLGVYETVKNELQHMGVALT